MTTASAPRKVRPKKQSSRKAPLNEEKTRLIAQEKDEPEWSRWGPYLSERQWGTVREDYSPHGEAWEYFSHDHARSRAYRWGEDGIAGISDKFQHLCLGLALWNKHDPILKERLFGLSNREGNHGEDVKELYYYLDATPTHSYLKMLYKYPQQAYPYTWLVEENGRRGKDRPEFELIDTGVFADDRYFDVFVEYAKADPHDILMRITAHNRGPDDAPLHILPQLWFRNEWTWDGQTQKPEISVSEENTIKLQHSKLDTYYCHFDGATELLFCDNETNVQRLYGTENQGYFKDAFHEYIVHGNPNAVNPLQNGTKAAGHFIFTIPAREKIEIRLRLTRAENTQPFKDFDSIFNLRQAEADEFYAVLQTDIADEDARLIQRQAFAGMIWSKQFYYIDIPIWLKGDPNMPAPPKERRNGRNCEWQHLNNADIISMPDKWEYPWYAAWDLAFHCITIADIDPVFAKNQLLLMTRVWYMHPNGQIPAYEWAFGDVNPPVHAWAVWEVYKAERDANNGSGDLDFLERELHMLLLNFTWWVNRKDIDGHNVFQGGFLGLDNIGVFDRSAPLPTGGHINQADGTSWMAMYALNLMRIALELAKHNATYEEIATKFFEHFLYIAQSMNNIGDHGVGLWDEADQFFYDVLRTPDGEMTPLKVRSMVGLIPLYAVEIIEPEILDRLPNFKRRLEWFMRNRPELAALVSHWQEPGRGNRHLLSLLRGHRMKALLRRMLDETEFLSDYGIRSLSRAHKDTPYVFNCIDNSVSVSYQPAESESGMFGGNSNWRGPIWLPVNYLLVTSLRRFAEFYGDAFKIECPTGSGNMLSIYAVADELALRLTRLFRRDGSGQRPVFGDQTKFQEDPQFRDYILFYEYFHGDTGRGVGASHQTGWSGLIAKLLQPYKHD
ncbi:Glucosidase [Candidatus Nitrotoga sp. HW29]|uniref:MGH1-like glycoside hydrolase domain-containing protein n=1 Tax=Candidatus Nitrotoga sp. HW29 TaxID=2886963 RepID=UPI001EF31F3F|nr:glucosidase [Candidatus Nitrotoga sp. HW29]CAH1904811.1 Glucosidase [Candidatus Nitrotoga sp. HW29]